MIFTLTSPFDPQALKNLPQITVSITFITVKIINLL